MTLIAAGEWDRPMTFRKQYLIIHFQLKLAAGEVIRIEHSRGVGQPPVLSRNWARKKLNLFGIEWEQVDAVHRITGIKEVVDRDHAIACEGQGNKIGRRRE